MKKERQFTARLKYFEVHVTSTTRDDGTEVHHITAGFPFEQAPKDYQPMQFVVGSASEVLDLLEVVDLSNELIESLHVSGGAGTEPAHPRLKLVQVSEREPGDGPNRLQQFADAVLTLLADSPAWGADTLQDIARLGEVHGLGTSDDAGRFRRVATSSRATSGVTLAGGAA